jgi:hypothetical protein
MNLFLNNRQARLLKIICDLECKKLENRLEVLEENEADPDEAMDIKIEVSDLRAISKKLAKHGITDEIIQ